MDNETKCFLCNSNNLTVLHRIRESRHRKNFRIVQCTKCGFIWTWPLPMPEKLAAFYPANYYSFSPQWTPLYTNGRWQQKIRNRLTENLLAREYGYVLTKNRQAPLINAIITFYRFIAPIFPRFIQGGRIVDVGTGCGEYLLHLAELGWDICGVEINDAAATIGQKEKGLDIHCGKLFDARFPTGYFDAVTMHHTLEHVQNPRATLNEINRILKEKGELVISGPNVQNWERWFFGKFWWGWDVPRHLWHFSPNTLSKLLVQCGFSVTKIVYQADMYELPRNMLNILTGYLPRHSPFFKKILDPEQLRIVTKYPMIGPALFFSVLGLSEKFAIFARKTQ